MARASAIAAPLAGLAAVIGLGVALAQQVTAPASPASTVRTASTASPSSGRPDLVAYVAAGAHYRVAGPRGPIHVWVPPGYRADSAITVVYVHGYFDTADTAWTAHQLPQQFAASAANALFVVPEAPVAQKLAINYPDLGELLRLVEDATGVPRGAAGTAAIGHSGAFRTLQAWLDEPTLAHIVLVDAVYGDEKLFATWFAGSPHRRLTTVSQDTLLGSEALAGALRKDTVMVDRFPPAWELWPAHARSARHLFIRGQYAHMQLVTEGIALPSLIRLLRGEQLAELPWDAPIVALPDASIDAAIDASIAVAGDGDAGADAGR